MPRHRAVVALFLVSTCVLAFEVALTRICSVLLQYHLSFAVVSMSILGLGIGGFVADALTRRDPRRSAGIAAAAIVALGPALLAALAVLLGLPFARAWPALLFLVLPVFVAAGAFQSLVLRDGAARVGTLYAADLAGGAAGAWIALGMLEGLGGPVHTALVLAVLAAGIACLWTGGAGRAGRASLVVLVATLATVVAQSATHLFDVRYERAPDKLLSRMLRPTPQGTPRLLPQLSRWDAYSRVDVLELDAPRGVQRLVFIDGETPTPMLASDPVSPNAAGVPIRDALAALPCRLQPPRHLLSIGSGGGYDVVLGKSFGADRIDAVELNAGVLQVVEAARTFTGDVYRQPGVTLHHAEGRTFVRRAEPAGYDLVLLALAQSLAGNLQEYALSENFLYTREAFDDYLRVLRPDGVLALLVSNPTVQRKLVRSALEVLEARGLPAADCVVALMSRGEVPYDHLVLVRAAPFPAAQIEALEGEIAARGYEVLQAPAPLTGSTMSLAPDAAALRLAPATDDRPFFFNVEPGTPGGLKALLGISLGLLAAAWFVFGVRLRRDPEARTATWGVGGYFVLLGLAFLMVEILVLQKSIRVLGFPTLNLGLVLSVFLVSAGCGSAASQRLRSSTVLRRLLLVLGLALLGLVPLLDRLQTPLERLPLVPRCFALAAVLFPFGFAMGMPFPSGIRFLRPALRWAIPWLWGLNGVASIAGSALVVAVVLQAGFRVTVFLPAIAYVLAAWAIRTLEHAPADVSDS